MSLADSQTFTTIVVTVSSICIGSFLNVCIYRIPRAAGFYEDEEELEDIREQQAEEKGSQIASQVEEENDGAPSEFKTFNDPPRSFCPKCENFLLWWHNLPIISWLFLGGKCYFCKEPISARYPAVELLAGILGIMSYHHFGLTLTGIVIFLFCCSLLVMSFIDYDYYILPNVITYPSFFIAIAIVVVNQYTGVFKFPICENLWQSFYGFMAGAGFLYIVSTMYLILRKKEGLGMGDVKLLAVTGVLFGPTCAFYTIFVGSLFGSVFGILMMLFMGRNFEKHIPFGPYLAVGTLFYIFSGLEVGKYFIL